MICDRGTFGVFHHHSIQSIFNGSNTFRTMKISSRQAKFELMSVNRSARSGGIIEIYFRFSST